MTRRAGWNQPVEPTFALDIGRGLSIVLVMYGHALAPWFMEAQHFSVAAFLQWKLGAAFLMPFFFALSGMSWRTEKTLKSTLRESLTLIFIAWLASIAADLLRIGFSLTGAAAPLEQTPLTFVAAAKNAVRMLVYADFYSLSPLWFLGALGLTRFISALLIRTHAVVAVLLTAALIGLGLGAHLWGWRNYQQVYLLGASIAFFLGGHLAVGAMTALVRHARLALAATLIGGAVLFNTFALNQGCAFDFTQRCGIPSLNGEFGVAMLYGAFGNIPLFYLTAIAGVVFGCGFIALTARFGGPVADRLGLWGRRTLNLLVANAIVVEFASPLVARWVAPQIPASNLVFFIALFAVAVTITMSLEWALRRPLRLLRASARNLARIVLGVLTLPISSWSDRPAPAPHPNEP